jgi:hypothetical protein
MINAEETICAVTSMAGMAVWECSAKFPIRRIEIAHGRVLIITSESDGLGK